MRRTRDEADTDSPHVDSLRISDADSSAWPRLCERARSNLTPGAKGEQVTGSTSNTESAVPTLVGHGIVVRAIAKEGTAKERTWVLKEPASLIGSHVHADIRFNDPAVGRSHAVIVNTGEEIVLVDLFTSAGVHVNGQPVNRTRVLHDGDAVRVGHTAFLIRIERTRPAPTASAKGNRSIHPLKSGNHLVVIQKATHARWRVDEKVVVIGRKQSAPICLEDDRMPVAQSVLFATPLGVCIYDVGSEVPLQVNHNVRKLAVLRDQDTVTIGDTDLMVYTEERPDSSFCRKEEAMEPQTIDETTAPEIAPQSESVEDATESGTGEQVHPFLNNGPVQIPDIPPAMKEPAAMEVESELGMLEHKILSFQEDIARSWGQMNDWKKRLTIEQNQMQVRFQDLQNKERMLTQLAEELQGRADELAARSARVEGIEAEFETRKDELKKMQMDLGRRETELQARCTKLTTLATELDAREKEVQRFADQYENQRRELEDIRASISEERLCIERDRREITAQRDQVQKWSEDLEKRQAQIQDQEHSWQPRQDAMVVAQAELDRQKEAVEQGKKSLGEYEEKCRGLFEQLSQKEQEQGIRWGVIERFGEFLTEATEVFHVTVNTPVTVSPSVVPPVPDVSGTTSVESGGPASGEASLEPVGAMDSTQKRIRTVVNDLEKKARRMVEEVLRDAPIQSIAPNPAETEPSSDILDSDQPEVAEPEMEHSTVGAPTVAVDVVKLEPEVRKRFRLLRRLGETRKSDVELVEQIRSELKLSHDRNGETAKKKRWWK